MFPTQGMIVSDDVAQIGDALLTLVRHEVRQETPEATSRRRLETFVLTAQRLVARLAERQEAVERLLVDVERREALLRYQVESAVRWQADAEIQWTAIHEGLAARLTRRESEADRAWGEILRLSYGVAHLEDHLAQATARLAILEARTLPARWARCRRWFRSLWPWRT